MLNFSCISGRHLGYISTSVSLSVDGFPWQETKSLSKIGRGRYVGPCSQHLGHKVCSSMLNKEFAPPGWVCRREVYRLHWRRRQQLLVQRGFPARQVPGPAFSPKPGKWQLVRGETSKERMPQMVGGKSWQKSCRGTWKVPVLPAKELARPAICWFSKPNLVSCYEENNYRRGQ